VLLIEQYPFNKMLKIEAVTNIIPYTCEQYWKQYYNVHTVIPNVYKRELATYNVTHILLY